MDYLQAKARDEDQVFQAYFLTFPILYFEFDFAMQVICDVHRQRHLNWKIYTAGLIFDFQVIMAGKNKEENFENAWNLCLMVVGFVSR